MPWAVFVLSVDDIVMRADHRPPSAAIAGLLIAAALAGCTQNRDSGIEPSMAGAPATDPSVVGADATAAVAAPAAPAEQTPEAADGSFEVTAGLPASQTWLIGGWGGNWHECNSDLIMEFRDDGTFETEGFVGTWTLVNSRIAAAVRAVDPWRSRAIPGTERTWVWRVADARPDSMTMISRDGYGRTIYRCASLEQPSES